LRGGLAGKNRMDDRNIVFETQDQVEATVLRSMLEANDIEVFVYQESLSSLYGFYSPSMGRISLGVHAENIEKAGEIVASYAKQSDPESQD
jgi:arginyl-tRNA--protein-N-Asp/Glu arginylyltransferase